MVSVLDFTASLPDFLKNRLTGPLPGREAQYKMASLRRLQELGHLMEPPEHAKVACVMLLLWQDPEREWRTVMIQRTANPLDRHSGQVSFPGGRYEVSDASLERVALRETYEELGIPPEQVEVLGGLTQLYIPVSNFVVHPFVGILHGQPEFVPQPGEVEHVLTPALGTLRPPEARLQIDLTLGNGMELKDVPYFEVEERVVWGATAMIMSEFLELLPSLPQHEHSQTT